MLDPVPIRILLLSDGRLKKEDSTYHFALTCLQQILEEEEHVGPFVFRVTREYIQDYSQVDLSRILGTDLYEEAWCFGDCYPLDSTIEHRPDEVRPTRALSPDEVTKFAEFMQTAGMFATGDHSDLGGALNGQTVRVRNMRRWSSRQNPPPRNGEQRHDTLRNPSGVGSGLPYKAIWQEDDIPQIIHPEPFVRYPHPLLSLPSGNITMLPDHMHEGECYAPPDNYIDFPISGGSRPVPFVVAKSQIAESHATDDYPGGQPDGSRNVTTPRGLICAYDGHTAGLGNVVVDSSFHHFLDVNLKGFAALTNIEAYTQIKTYFRNIARFLAPTQHRLTAFRRILLAVASNLNLSSSTTHQLDSLISIGTKARAMASRMVSPSFVIQWALELANDSGIPELSLVLVSPWAYGAAGSNAYSREAEMVVTAIIGSAVVSIRESTRALQAGGPAYSDARLNNAARKGLAELARVLAQLPGSVPEARSENPEGINPKGETSMPGIWYEGEWLLFKSDTTWKIRVFLILGVPNVQIAPCSNPESGCLYTSPTPIKGPNNVQTGDVSVSFCTKVTDPATKTESAYCFMIKFYYRSSVLAQTLSFRYLKHGSAAVGVRADTSLDDDGSGTGTRPGTTLLVSDPPALKRPVITGDEKGDDGSGTGTQPGSTVEP